MINTCLYRLNPIKSYIEKAVKTESDNVQPQEIKAQANHTEIEKTQIGYYCMETGIKIIVINSLTLGTCRDAVRLSNPGGQAVCSGYNLPLSPG